MAGADPAALGRHDSWDGVRAVVAGFGVAGFAAADNLNHLGATVVVLDEEAAEPGSDRAERAELLGVLGVDLRLDAGATATLPEAVDLLVVSPGWLDDAPVLVQARERGVPVWGEVELAWRLRDPAHTTPWLCVAGEPEATAETVRMLEAVLRTEGLRTVAVGDSGLPLVEVVMDPEPYDVLAIGLTAAQLRHSRSMAARAAAVLGVPAGEADDLARAYEQVELACVYLTADPATEELVREADVQEGARAIGVTLGMPGVGTLGVVEDLLADRAFIAQRDSSAAELCTLGDLPEQGPEHVTRALVAAALARAHGVGQVAVRDGLRGLRDPGGDAT
ncbi:MAG: hypothetical protein ACXVW0_02500 [Nocardioides sp.]